MKTKIPAARRRNGLRPSRALRGFSLIELMIGVALGLVVLAALTSFFVSTSASRHEIERTSRQIENGRFAIDMIRTGLHHAGFFAELQKPPVPPLPQTPPVDWTAPDPCLTTVASLGFAKSPLNVPVPVFGYDKDNSLIPSCISDRKPGTDVLVVRRFNTEPVPVGQAQPNHVYFQPSRCATDSTTDPWFFDLGAMAGTFNLRKVDCGTLSDIYRYRVEIYYVRNCSVTTFAGICTSDNIPTLVRLELDEGIMRPVPLVEGIHDMRVAYGIDQDNNGSPDVFVRCDSTAPCTPGNWAQVTAVRVHVLAVNMEPTVGYNDTKTYDMGSGVPQVLGPFNDMYKRHVYAALVTLPNRAGFWE